MMISSIPEFATPDLYPDNHYKYQYGKDFHPGQRPRSPTFLPGQDMRSWRVHHNFRGTDQRITHS